MVETKNNEPVTEDGVVEAEEIKKPAAEITEETKVEEPVTEDGVVEAEEIKKPAAKVIVHNHGGMVTL